MTSDAVALPQKRKSPEPSTRKNSERVSTSADPDPRKGEYESGRIICEACGQGVSFRDEATGGFTVQHWEAHRFQCNSSRQVSDTDPEPEVSQAVEDQIEESQPPAAKRRRAKRTEEERIEYLRSDPYVAELEPYRIKCASCDKWIRLRPNSTYCSIPWDAHRKSCLAKKVAKSAHSTDDRHTVFSADPDIRKFDAERILCRICETWVQLGTHDSTQAIKTWQNHRASCQQEAEDPPKALSHPPPANIPAINSVPPPPKHLLALASSSSLPTSAGTAANGGNASISARSSPIMTEFKAVELTPTSEPRRRNADQRLAQLRSDPLAGDVEPNRVFCTLCQKWVQLRQDSAYCAYPWQQHRNKCIKRLEKRSRKEAERAQRKNRGDAAHATQRVVESEEPESEEGVESGNEGHIPSHHGVGGIANGRSHGGEAQCANRATTNGVVGKSFSSADEDELEDEMEVDELQSFGRADLETSGGRLEFTSQSVDHLFRSTYGPGDNLTIASLVTYLNAAIPPDRYEDFDTAEVTKAATALCGRGQYLFEGDSLRIKT